VANLTGKYMLFSTAVRDYYAWFDTDAGATDPAVSARTGIPIYITTGMTVAQIVDATYYWISSQLAALGDHSVTVKVDATSRTITLESTVYANLTDATNGNLTTYVVCTVLTQGAAITSGTAGWIKLAEVYVPAGASALDSTRIRDYRVSQMWRGDVGKTIPISVGRTTSFTAGEAISQNDVVSLSSNGTVVKARGTGVVREFPVSAAGPLSTGSFYISDTFGQYGSLMALNRGMFVHALVSTGNFYLKLFIVQEDGVLIDNIPISAAFTPHTGATSGGVLRMARISDSKFALLVATGKNTATTNVTVSVAVFEITPNDLTLGTYNFTNLTGFTQLWTVASSTDYALQGDIITMGANRLAMWYGNSTNGRFFHGIEYNGTTGFINNSGSVSGGYLVTGTDSEKIWNIDLKPGNYFVYINAAGNYSIGSYVAGTLTLAVLDTTVAQTDAPLGQVGNREFMVQAATTYDMYIIKFTNDFTGWSADKTNRALKLSSTGAIKNPTLLFDNDSIDGGISIFIDMLSNNTGHFMNTKLIVGSDRSRPAVKTHVASHYGDVSTLYLSRTKHFSCKGYDGVAILVKGTSASGLAEFIYVCNNSNIIKSVFGFAVSSAAKGAQVEISNIGLFAPNMNAMHKSYQHTEAFDSVVETVYLDMATPGRCTLLPTPWPVGVLMSNGYPNSPVLMLPDLDSTY
jgi:hypothetical protein